MKRFMRYAYILLPLSAVLLHHTPGGASGLNGREVAEKVFSRPTGEDSLARMEMTLVDRRGNRRTRSFALYNKSYGELQKTFIRFSSPRDIEGTGFLAWENPEGDDTQYLFLPELGRSRRIVARQRNLRFVNSDLTYEDMQRRKVDMDRHELLREEEWEGHTCYVVEYRAIDERSSQYGKVIQWVDKNSFVPVKAQFFNRRGDLFKRLTVEELGLVSGIWTATRTLIEDSSQEHKTVLEVKDVQYDLGLDDGLFTVRNLENP